jgi:leucine dehydrogenase
VASYLAEYLLKENATLFVSDVNKNALLRAEKLGCSIVEDPEKVYDIPCEIFSPCALGGTLNSKTIPRLQCKVVAGCANNQLLDDNDADLLEERGILYAPDYVINAGGVINLSFELPGPYSEVNAFEHVEKIFGSVSNVIQTASNEGISTNRAAARIAEARISSVRNVKSFFRGNLS